MFLFSFGFLALIFLFIVGFVAIYNGLVNLRNRSEEAWSDIDVQLKRRYDLIPNLVETVKGYQIHEKETLENVTKARNMAIAATTPVQKADAENILTSSLKSLFAVAENYPNLKANENFLELQTKLSEIEEEIQRARMYYNAIVRDLNNKIEMFPSNFVANMYGFKKKEYFELEVPEEERKVPKVKF